MKGCPNDERKSLLFRKAPFNKRRLSLRNMLERSGRASPSAHLGGRAINEKACFIDEIMLTDEIFVVILLHEARQVFHIPK